MNKIRRPDVPVRVGSRIVQIAVERTDLRVVVAIPAAVGITGSQNPPLCLLPYKGGGRRPSPSATHSPLRCKWFTRDRRPEAPVRAGSRIGQMAAERTDLRVVAAIPAAEGIVCLPVVEPQAVTEVGR